MKLNIASILAAVTAAILLAGVSGCGGGGSSGTVGATTPTIASGVFIDSAVEGLSYVSGSTSGKTNAAGTFQYEVGQNVTFRVGGVVLGTASPKAVVTPVNLVAGATNEMNATVTNIARFLQTIDNDGNPANGITISTAAETAAQGLTLNFAQSVAAFEADPAVTAAAAAITAATTAGVRPLVSENSAQSHLRENLLARLVGTYAGTFTGSFGGSYSVAINAAGTVSGGGNDQFGNPFTVTGTVSSNGQGTFGIAGCATFTGTVNADTGAISGTWTGACGSGTYSGQKQ